MEADRELGALVASLEATEIVHCDEAVLCNCRARPQQRGCQQRASCETVPYAFDFSCWQACSRNVGWGQSVNTGIALITRARGGRSMSLHVIESETMRLAVKLRSALLGSCLLLAVAGEVEPTRHRIARRTLLFA